MPLHAATGTRQKAFRERVFGHEGADWSAAGTVGTFSCLRRSCGQILLRFGKQFMRMWVVRDRISDHREF